MTTKLLKYLILSMWQRWTNDSIYTNLYIPLYILLLSTPVVLRTVILYTIFLNTSNDTYNTFGKNLNWKIYKHIIYNLTWLVLEFILWWPGETRWLDAVTNSNVCIVQRSSRLPDGWPPGFFVTIYLTRIKKRIPTVVSTQTEWGCGVSKKRSSFYDLFLNFSHDTVNSKLKIMVWNIIHSKN